MDQKGKLIPFGKYKGQPIEVLEQDPSYVDWLSGQSWVRERYSNFYTVIINNLEETGDTPEHNTMQAMFLDDSFCRRVMHACFHQRYHNKNEGDSYPGYIRKKLFEANGIDVTLDAVIWKYRTLFNYGKWEHYWEPKNFPIHIELKPSVGDDYPGVLRLASKMPWYRVVICRHYCGIGATVDQVREMFDLSDIMLIGESNIPEWPDLECRTEGDISQYLEYSGPGSLTDYGKLQLENLLKEIKGASEL